MEHQEFILEVSRLVEQAAKNGFKPVKMAASTGVIIVQDSKGEFDTYFDKDKWKFIFPTVWERGGASISDEIGILPGTGRCPAVSSFEMAVQFASEHLCSRDPMHTFYPQLQSVN